MPFTPRTKEESLEEIKNLVQTFSRNYKSYTSKDYDEANTRTDFIDKFFEALNWDVRNDGAKAERFREVVREDKVKIADQTKAPDYSFRIGGQKIFFVEAKKPNVNIKEYEAPAFQVRRYAYTAKLPLSILTDFEEFAVYDTKIKPAQKDNASTARIKYIRYTDYEKEFDFLWNTFSKQAVENGSFDNYAEEAGGKKGTGEIDSALLDLIETWRLSLAKNIALRNETLSLRNLNAAVQKIIDRIIFLRIAEDKEMENYGTLQNAAKQADIYGSLKKIFLDADKKYNSGIFKNESWINALLIDDKILKEIIDELYYPKCPYVWAALPVEILGNIYEKFLGSEITFKNIKGGHTATVEQKPEIKKAGGVFYTPRYIVEYIVSQTLGKKLENLSPKEADKITVLDPACGSGSFLVGAYKYLLNWYLEQYTKSEPAAKNALKENKIAETTRGLSLSVEEKKRILTGHIFGVDIDSQAVEVTKLSLFLQMLEGEGKELHGTQSDLFRSSDLTILPDMSANIRCGNSLIASDFYANAQGTLFDDEAMIKVNAFDWEKAFGKMPHGFGSPNGLPFKRGGVADSNPCGNRKGFDVVIGNPPYVNINTMSEYHEYFAKHYGEIHTGYNDLMYYFLYKGISLLSTGGVFGMITSNYFLGNDYAKKLRLFLNKNVERIINFREAKIFQEASVHTAIVFAQKGATKGTIEFYTYKNSKAPQSVELNEDYEHSELVRKDLGDTWIVADSSSSAIIEKIKKGAVYLGDITEIEKGSSSGKNDAFTLPKKLAEELNLEKDLLRQNVKNGDIHQYLYSDRGNVLIYTDNDTDIKKYPKILEYLKSHKKELSARNEVAKGAYPWWRFERPRNKAVFDAGEKLIVPYRAEHNRFAYDNAQCFNDGGDIRAIVVKEHSPYSIKALLVLLNSALLDWYFGFIGKAKGKSREYFNKPLAEIPLPALEGKTLEEANAALARLADAMLSAVQKEQTAVSEEDKRIARQRINALDAQINALVYKLYGLTDEEIEVVENAR